MTANALPLADPIAIFGVAMLVFLLAPLILERYRLPGIVGIILVGAAIGPNGVGLLARDATFVLLGEVGIVYLMFLAGVEISPRQFAATRERSLVFGLLSFLIPQLSGTVAGVAVLDLGLPAALLFGAIFSSHTLLAFPIVDRLGVTQNEAVTVSIGGTILTDTLALLVLAVVIAGVDGDIGAGFWLQLAVGLIVFFAAVWVLVPRIARWFLRSVSHEGAVDFLFVMTVLFAAAVAAELVGVKHIIGAFLAGVALHPLIPATGALMNRIEFVGNALFIPFFLLAVGMLVDVRVLVAGQRTILLAGSLLVLLVLTKFIAAWLTGAWYDYPRSGIMGMYGLSLGQAAAALAIVMIGFDAGVPGFDQHMINAVVLMILVISVISPAIVERAGRDIRREQASGAVIEPDPVRRVLVAVSPNARYSESLLTFAMLLREPDSVQPIYTATVVESGSDTPAAIEAAEARFPATESIGAGADVAVEPRAVVAPSIATGIIRAIAENRITTVIIGWDGAPSRGQRAFGSNIDRVIRGTEQLIFVTRAREPLSGTDRILLVVPPGSRHAVGWPALVGHVGRIANQTDATIHGISIATEPAACERAFTEFAPTVPVDFQRVETWAAAINVLGDTAESADLVVCVSARRGAMGWHDSLQSVPGRIAAAVPGNFAIAYPAVGGKNTNHD